MVCLPGLIVPAISRMSFTLVSNRRIRAKVLLLTITETNPECNYFLRKDRLKFPCSAGEQENIVISTL